MTKKKIEITEAAGDNVPFRLFSSLDHVRVQGLPKWGDVAFWVRPMTAPEKAVFDAAERRLIRSQRWADARELAGVDPEEKLTGETFARVSQYLNVDLEAVKTAQEAYTQTILACVRGYEVDGGQEERMTRQIADTLVDVVRVWLMDQISNMSTLTDAERTAL
jgi:hypothetical protein